MKKDTIFKEFINRIANLSDAIYPIITNMDNNISYVPKRLQIFLVLRRVITLFSLTSLRIVSMTLTFLNTRKRFVTALIAKSLTKCFMFVWESIPRNI